MGRRVESVIFSYSELAQTHVNSYLFLLERRCLCLECFDFRFSLSAADIELSSSSSSSRGTGNRSRRILGNGFTSTVTGFFGISSKSGKLANSSALNSGCAGGWGELPPTVRMDGVLGLSCLLLCWNRLADVGLGGIVVATLARLLGDLSPCGGLEPIVFSTLLTGRTSLNDVIEDVILLFGERELACGSFGCTHHAAHLLAPTVPVAFAISVGVLGCKGPVICRGWRRGSHAGSFFGRFGCRG